MNRCFLYRYENIKCINFAREFTIFVEFSSLKRKQGKTISIL